MQMNGAKYPPRNSQSHTAWSITFHTGANQKIARSMYASLKVREVSLSFVGPENDKGVPSRTARTAAREKLRTDVAEMTADAKKRVNDFKSIHIGAVFLVSTSILSMSAGANNTGTDKPPRAS